MNDEEDKDEDNRPKRKKSSLKLHHKVLIALVIPGALLVWAPTLYAKISTQNQRYDLNKTAINNIPTSQAALVLGAGIYPNGIPTPYLRWRVDTAVKLYKAHRVQKLLMSADNSTSHHNEPVAMQKLALSEGVPASDIVLDYAGFSTYDSCYRAKAIFEVSSLTIVTQGYHLPRALMICKGLGIHSIGVRAQAPQRDFTAAYIAREWLSTDKAVLELAFSKKPTVLGPAEPIQFK